MLWPSGGRPWTSRSQTAERCWARWGLVARSSSSDVDHSVLAATAVHWHTRSTVHRVVLLRDRAPRVNVGRATDATVFAGNVERERATGVAVGTDVVATGRRGRDSSCGLGIGGVLQLLYLGLERVLGRLRILGRLGNLGGLGRLCRTRRGGLLEVGLGRPAAIQQDGSEDDGGK